MGGPAHQACLLSGLRLDPERYETLLVYGAVPRGEQSMADLAIREGARAEFLPSLVQPVRPHHDLSARARLRAIAQEFRPDIVHTHMAKAGLIGRSAALRVEPRPAIVHTYHGHVLEGYFPPPMGRGYRALERRMARYSDCLIGVSQATVDDLVRLGVASRDRFRVIPLGLDLEPFLNLDGEAGQAFRQEVGVAPEETLVTYVGRVAAIKRLDVLLRGVAEARRQAAPVRLAVVGDGETRPELERLASELGIGEAVTFLGYRRDLGRVAAGADVAALSSANEGTPVSLIEAGAAGRPAVASDVGGVRDVVTEETGLLFKAGDHRSLGSALARLSADEDLRRRLGRRARDHVIKRYSIERLLRDLDALYSELLPPTRPVGASAAAPVSSDG